MRAGGDLSAVAPAKADESFKQLVISCNNL
jgi:hypothetical protein